MKILYLLMFFMLAGCVTPNFVSHTQEIDLEDFYAQNPDAKVFYKGEEQTDTIKLFRSWKDKEIIIKKEGFKDYHIKLESVYTDDLWGKDNIRDGYMSSLWMLLPVNSLGACAFGSADSMSSAGGESALILLALCGAVGSPADAVNYASLPILPLWNPWKEYDAEELQKNNKTNADGKLKPTIILEPTDELRQSCNKQGYFISNVGCTPCASKDIVVATKEESDKCINSDEGRRFIDKFGLSHSCSEETDIFLEDDQDVCWEI